MSVENVKAFFEKVEGDKELQEKLKPSTEGGALDEVVAIAAEAGFEFTVEDFAEVLEAGGEGELSDEELKRVAGGGGCDRGYQNRCKKSGSPY